jgi:signal transduction histidine kinase
MIARVQGRRSVRARLFTTFAMFAIGGAALFGLAATIFVYTVEDRMFATWLDDEAAHLVRSAAPAGAWPVPRADFMSVHVTPADLPDDLRAALVADPLRREAAGTDARHYHITRLPATDTRPAGWLVAEVSRYLAVRPMRLDLLATWGKVVAVILVAALASAWMVARRISRPLLAVSDAVRSLDPLDGAAAPLSDRVPHADREIAVVARAIDELSTRLRTVLAREQAFTRDVSHELRTPLAVLRTTMQQTQDDATLTPRTRRLVTLAEQSAEDMQRSVESLLALARGAPASTAPTRVLPVIEQVIVSLAAPLDRVGLTVVLDVPHEATLPLPASDLHLIVSNLISNAIAHGGRGTTQLVVRDDALIVSNPMRAVDAGDEFVSSIASADQPSDRGGSGLGLMIVRRICARHGLTLSTAPNKTGRFVATVAAIGEAPPATH